MTTPPNWLSRLLLVTVLLLGGHLATRAAVPPPLAQWTFEGHTLDVAGTMHGTLVGDATVLDGRLILKGNGYVRTAPLPVLLAEKTLVARVKVDPPDQGGGGVLTVQAGGGAVFDSIVYGERVPRQWMAGSDWFRRTRDLGNVQPEEAVGFVHVAVVYQADGRIAVFRNGQPYGEPYRPAVGLQVFGAGSGEVLLGLRHTGGANPYLRGEIEEAALYNVALNSEQVAELASQPTATDPNRIANGGFENGPLLPWQVSGANPPPTLVVAGEAAQDSWAFRPQAGPDGLRLLQTIPTEAGQEYLLRLAYRPLDEAPGSIGIEAGGQRLAAVELSGTSPATRALNGGKGWLYTTRNFTATAAQTDVVLTFAPLLNGRVLVDDVQCRRAADPGPVITLEWTTNRVALVAGAPASVTVRRTGGLNRRAYASLELVPGTADVSGPSRDLWLLDDPTRERMGLVFGEGEREVTVRLSSRVADPNEGTETASLRLVATGNARVAGPPLEVVLQAPPPFGQAMEFNGVDQFVSIPHDPALNSFPLTISFWLQTTQLDSFIGLVAKYVSGSGNGWDVHLSDGRLRSFHFVDWGSAIYTGDTAADRPNGGFVADGSWHQVAYVVDAAGGRLYVDGELKDFLEWRGTPGAPTHPVNLTLGNAPLLPDGTGDAHFRGRMDEVRIWSLAMTDVEVRASMFSTLTGNEPGLVAYYNFNQSGGSILTNRAVTGSRFNGQLRGTSLPRWVDWGDPSQSPGRLVANGGFENPSLHPWQLSQNSVVITNPPAPSLSWRLSAQGVRHLAFLATSTNQNPMRLFQTIPTEPGTEYRLTFAHAVGIGRTGSVGVELGGNPVEAVPVDGRTSILPEAGIVGNWGTFLYAHRIFTAASSATEVALLIPPELSGALILDDIQVTPTSDALPEIQLELASPALTVEEGTTVAVTLRRTGRLTSRAYATLVLEPGTALVGPVEKDLEFQGVSGNRLGLVFQPNQETIAIQINGWADALREPPETALLRLLPTGNARVTGDPVPLTVIDPQGRVWASGSASEAGGGWIALAVDRGSGIRVRVQTTDAGSAKPGEDFEPLDQEVTLAAGRETRLPLRVVRDGRIEGRETLGVRITPASTNTLVMTSELLIPVTDDPEVRVAPEDSGPRTVSEAAGVARLVLVRSGALNHPQTFQVRYRLEGLAMTREETGQDAAAARPGVDFIGTEGVVEFGPGVSRRTLEVMLPNNTEQDGPRAFVLRLLGTVEFGEAGGIGQGEMTVIITDDERPVLRQDVAISPFLRTPFEVGPKMLARPGGGTLLLDRGRALQWTASGIPDVAFGRGTGQARDEIWGGDLRQVHSLPDGRLVFAEPGQYHLLRWTTNGTPDPTFGNGSGVVEVGEAIHRVVHLTPEGELTLTTVSDSGRILLRRWRADGQPNPDFNSYDLSPSEALAWDPEAYSVRLAPDGRFWVAHDGRLRRLEPDGRIHPAFEERPGIRQCFGFDALGRAYCQLAPGEGLAFGDESQGSLVRFTAEGTYDWSYRPTTAGADVPSAEVSPDGSTLVVMDGSLVEFDPAGQLRREHPVQLDWGRRILAARRDDQGRVLLTIQICWIAGCWSYSALFSETDGRLIYDPPPLADSVSEWTWIAAGSTGPDGSSADTDRIWRTLKPATTPQAGFSSSAVFASSSSVRIPVQRSGNTTEPATIRGLALRWHRGRWTDSNAVPFEVSFLPGYGEADAELTLPSSSSAPPVGEYLLRLESASGVDVSVLNECRLWVFRESALPAPGGVALFNPAGPDTPDMVWLTGSPAILRRSSTLTSPNWNWSQWWMDSPVRLGPVWLSPLSTEGSSAGFFRMGP